MPNRHDKTLTQILFQLASFLPPDDVVAIVAQIERAIPSDLSGTFFAEGSLSASALADLPQFIDTPQSPLAIQLDAMQEMYPARAAALYLRVLLNIVSNLFEQRALHTLNDDMLNLLIDGLLRSEAILDARCIHCPKISVSLQ